MKNQQSVQLGKESGEVTNSLAVAELTTADAIRSRVFTARGTQVMLDRDLAELYGVEVGQLNRQVKRNIERFPEDFMFQLTHEDCSRCQIGILNGGRGSNIKYLPYVFTENGIAMLSSVLRSPRAIAANIQIMRAFTAMRKALASLAPLLSRIEATERRQMKQEDAQVRNEERFKLILDAMQDKKFPPQKVFFDGQVYDAFDQMKKFVRMAKSELIVIDPYFDDSVLPLIAQKRPGVAVLVVKNSRKNQLHGVDVAQFNAQYGDTLTVKESDKFHDRFLIIDKSTLVHVGASLNHLGKKCFAFSSLDKSNIPDILAKLLAVVPSCGGQWSFKQ